MRLAVGRAASGHGSMACGAYAFPLLGRWLSQGAWCAALPATPVIGALACHPQCVPVRMGMGRCMRVAVVLGMHASVTGVVAPSLVRFPLIARRSRAATPHPHPNHCPLLLQPKEIKEIRDFLTTARRKDAKSVKVMALKTATKFKIRCSRVRRPHALPPPPFPIRRRSAGVGRSAAACMSASSVASCGVGEGAVSGRSLAPLCVLWFPPACSTCTR
jgi:hypothetical protein